MRIFGKIFLGFWLATFAMISILLLVSLSGLLKPQPLQPLPHPRHTLHDLARQFSEHGTVGVDRWLGRHPYLNRRDIVIADPTGRIVYPTDANAAMRELIEQWPAQSRRVARRRFGGFYLGAQVRDGHRLLLRFPSPWQARLRDDPWLAFVIALLVSGLVCFVVARALTRPLARLGETVERFARGDLTARVALRNSSRDEIHRLAASFNHMADQLAARIADQQRLVKDVSHELRSPLARLRLGIALARDDRDGDTNGYAIERLERDVEQLEAIISDLLLLPQSGTGQFQLDEVIDLVALVETVVADCCPLDDAAAPVEVALPDAPLLYRGNGRLLYSMLSNLVLNALRYTPATGVVRVAVACRGDAVILTVHDGGPGVPTDQLGRIFEPFHRLSSSRERGEGGSGLGLAIVRRATELHGGSVTAANAGVGLVVTIDLPADRLVDTDPG